MYQVDLNSDIGESFGNYKLGLDQEVVKHITSANIACGWHAGDPLVMEQTVRIAKENGVQIGAHPGLPDLMGFGRRKMELTPTEAKAYVKYQLGALVAFAQGADAKVKHLKPHGALYNLAAEDGELARAIAEAIYEVDRSIILVGLAGSQLIEAGLEQGLQVANEVFADRAYNSDGTLVSRRKERAVIHDSQLAVERVVKMVKEGKVEAITGEEIEVKADTVCLHGDNPQAVELAVKIKEGLKKEGIKVNSMSCFL
ncbi:LamB/YcsF family protein [Natroniella sulfidigena]|uniref:LamB/YcsF family protein n=1 Tax=Natroniella sulfidigena TaxID=723921 RepID=UPI00200AC705|nr:5-oxoprolinase subunit PxpA [Natroniella sulfidigena]MCK8816904.1 LamB/YcsF family protein [Natroniella sulfidigena]